MSSVPFILLQQGNSLESYEQLYKAVSCKFLVRDKHAILLSNI